MPANQRLSDAVEEYLIRSAEEMEALGASVAKKLAGGEVICLRGELGSGKTTFVRGLARGLGMEKGYQVRSPTFTLVNEYPTEKGRLIHIDLYRVRDFDWSEFLGEGILAVEWGQGELCDLDVEIEISRDGSRRVRIFSRK